MAKLRKKVGKNEYYLRDVYFSGKQKFRITYQVSDAGVREFFRLGIRDGHTVPEYLVKKFRKYGYFTTDSTGAGVESVDLRKGENTYIDGTLIGEEDYAKLSWETRQWIAKMLISYPGCKAQNLKENEDGGVSFELENVPVSYIINLYEMALKYDGSGFIDQLESVIRNRIGKE